MLRPVFITYDKDKKMLGIFEDKTEDKKRFNLYKKTDIDTNSEWQFIEKDKIVSLVYDKDQILIGLDTDGQIYSWNGEEWISLSFEAEEDVMILQDMMKRGNAAKMRDIVRVHKLLFLI